MMPKALPGCQLPELISAVPTKAYPYLAEPLLSGERLLIYVDTLAAGGCKVWSCAGGAARSQSQVTTHFAAELDRRGGQGLVFDGVADWAGYQVFDAYRPTTVTTYHGNKASQQVVVPFHVRRDYLELLFEAPEHRRGHRAPAADQRVTLIEQRTVTGRKDAEDAHDYYVINGHCGTVFKQPGASYVFDQTSGWQVLKGG
jgi:nucleotide-binding universal stress UspA family protein